MLALLSAPATLQGPPVEVSEPSESGQMTTLPVGEDPFIVAAGDINGDSYPDIITANH